MIIRQFDRTTPTPDANRPGWKTDFDSSTAENLLTIRHRRMNHSPTVKRVSTNGYKSLFRSICEKSDIESEIT